jgi:hypothetical protein
MDRYFFFPFSIHKHKNFLRNLEQNTALGFGTESWCLFVFGTEIWCLLIFGTESWCLLVFGTESWSFLVVDTESWCWLFRKNSRPRKHRKKIL